MKQSRLGSFVEAWVNVIIGYTINFTANMLIFPLFGWNISWKQNVVLGGAYTVISVIRSYAIRRWFNRYIHRFASKFNH